MANQNVIAVKGLVGWHVQGISGPNCSFSSGPYDAPPGDCLAIDMSDVYERSENAVGLIWKRPTLAPTLAPGNVRNLFEGCIGYAGSVNGHPWDGQLSSLESTDSVGVDVYAAVLLAQGGKIVISD